MNIDAIAIGHNPPDDVNVVIEVPLGGERSGRPWTSITVVIFA